VGGRKGRKPRREEGKKEGKNHHARERGRKAGGESSGGSDRADAQPSRRGPTRHTQSVPISHEACQIQREGKKEGKRRKEEECYKERGERGGKVEAAGSAVEGI